MNHLMRFILSVFMFSGYVLAQDCASLLEGAQIGLEVQTIEQRLSVSSYANTEVPVIDIYQIVDRTNSRIYQETGLPGTGKVIFRYVNGQATMQLGDTNTNLPVPPMLLGQLERTLDTAFSQQGLVPSNYEVLSCDGFQSYGDLVAGEQVTVRAEQPDLVGGATEMRLLFNDDGSFVGSFVDIPNAGPSLTLVDEYVLDEQNIPVKMVFTVYQIENDQATSVATTTMETLSYNQEIDNALFVGP